jgi:hypothetical protein
MIVFDGHTKMCKETVLCVSQQYQYYNHLGNVTPCGKKVGTVTKEPVAAICNAEHKDNRFL